jgi:zinc transporter ZupT
VGKLYLILGLIGTVFPYYFFIQFLRDNGLDLGLLMELLFTNTISAFFAVDFIISCVVFLVFMFNESRKYNIKEKWICLLSLFTVGLSLALPLFLFFRHSYINSKVKYKLENKHVPAKISKMFIQVSGAFLE